MQIFDCAWLDTCGDFADFANGLLAERGDTKWCTDANSNKFLANGDHILPGDTCNVTCGIGRFLSDRHRTFNVTCDHLESDGPTLSDEDPMCIGTVHDVL